MQEREAGRSARRQQLRGTLALRPDTENPSHSAARSNLCSDRDFDYAGRHREIGVDLRLRGDCT